MNFQDQILSRKKNCINDVQVSFESASALLHDMRKKRDTVGVTKAQRQTIKSLGAALGYAPARWDIHQRIENYAIKVLG